MNAQFNMVGKNGTAAETGTTFTGASTASYKVSNFFAFQVPAPGAATLLGATLPPCRHCPQHPQSYAPIAGSCSWHHVSPRFSCTSIPVARHRWAASG
jgi:hypothetical protein